MKVIEACLASEILILIHTTAKNTESSLLKQGEKNDLGRNEKTFLLLLFVNQSEYDRIWSLISHSLLCFFIIQHSDTLPRYGHKVSRHP